MNLGLYGVMSYLVAQRTRKFGIRLALGSSRLEIVSRVLRDGMWWCDRRVRDPGRARDAGRSGDCAEK